MSLRIQNDAPGGINQQGINGTHHADQANGAAGHGRGAAGVSQTDQIDVSSAASSISDGLSATAAQHSARVQALGALYTSGNYNVDAAGVSRAIVSNGLSVGGTNAGE